jgi:hypothetical protein
MVIKEYKRQDDYRERKKKRREKKFVRAKMASNVACCYGCGAPFQVEEKDAPGFVDPETYEVVMRVQVFFFIHNFICIRYAI